MINPIGGIDISPLIVFYIKTNKRLLNEYFNIILIYHKLKYYFLFLLVLHSCDNPLVDNNNKNCIIELGGFYDDCNICSGWNRSYS